MQIAALWKEILEKRINQVLPLVEKENLEFRSLGILVALLSERAECWILWSNDRVKSVFVTSVRYEEVFRYKYLYIYVVSGTLNRGEWVLVIDTFKTFAKGKGAQVVLGLSTEPSIARGAELLGGETQYMVHFPVTL